MVTTPTTTCTRGFRTMTETSPLKNVRQLGGEKLDPKVMLLRILESVDEFDSVSVVIKNKDGTSESWSTSGDPWFLFAAASIVQKDALALLSQRNVEAEEEK